MNCKISKKIRGKKNKKLNKKETKTKSAQHWWERSIPFFWRRFWANIFYRYLQKISFTARFRYKKLFKLRFLVNFSRSCAWLRHCALGFVMLTWYRLALMCSLTVIGAIESHRALTGILRQIFRRSYWMRANKPSIFRLILNGLWSLWSSRQNHHHLSANVGQNHLLLFSGRKMNDASDLRSGVRLPPNSLGFLGLNLIR